MGVIEELMGFLDSSLTCYHAVCEVEKRLLQAGFTRLSERKAWELGKGPGNYLIINYTAIMQLALPDGH